MVNGKPCKANDRIENGITISIPSLDNGEQRLEAREQVLGLRDQLKILWEGLGLIAVNKPAGLAVHGDDSLDSIVRSYLSCKLSPSLSFTPGPLHRIDKPSSGIVVFSSSLEGARTFSALIREQKVKKTYLAVIEGILDKEEIWQDELVRDKEIKKTFVWNKLPLDLHELKRINAKTAVTKVTPLNSDGKNTLIKAQIETGRTHQIRAQASSHGYPLIGDIKYGAKKIKDKKLERKNKDKVDIFLHAWRLEFLDIKIEAPIPDSWHSIINIKM